VFYGNKDAYRHSAEGRAEWASMIYRWGAMHGMVVIDEGGFETRPYEKTNVGGDAV